MNETNRPLTRPVRCPEVTAGRCSGRCNEQEFLCGMCLRWLPWCMGHSTGDECCDCWYKLIMSMTRFVEARGYCKSSKIERSFNRKGWSKKRIRAELEELVDAGKIVKHKHGYRPTEAA